MSEKPNEDKVKASPAARRIAKELGIDLNDVAASSQAERIQLEDVQQYHELLQQQSQTETEISQSEPNPPISASTDDANESTEETEEDVIVFNMEEDADNQPEPVAEEMVTEAPATEQPSTLIQEESETNDSDEELGETELAEEPLDLENAAAIKENEKDETMKPEDNVEKDPAVSDETCCEDNFMFLPPMPLSISFEVSDENIRAMLAGLSIPLEDGLIPTVIKAAASAFEITENMLYEGRMNLIEYEDGEFVAQTVTDAQSKKISEMDYDTETEEEEDPDIPINIWDLSSFGFSNFQKTDTDQMNLFVLRKNDRILIDMTCDEYVMDVTEATAFMHQLQQYLENLSYMLL
jgi:hypothetical protein